MNLIKWFFFFFPVMQLAGDCFYWENGAAAPLLFVVRLPVISVNKDISRHLCFSTFVLYLDVHLVHFLFRPLLCYRVWQPHETPEDLLRSHPGLAFPSVTGWTRSIRHPKTKTLQVWTFAWDCDYCIRVTACTYLWLGLFQISYRYCSTNSD